MGEHQPGDLALAAWGKHLPEHKTLGICAVLCWQPSKLEGHREKKAENEKLSKNLSRRVGSFELG